MSLRMWRRTHYAAPTVFVTLGCFVSTLLSPGLAHADVSSSLAGIVSGTADGQSGASTLGAIPAASNAPEALATVDLSTGAARLAYSFELPRARGDAQPSLGLHYDSSSGVGFAGVGWSLNVPSIVRKGAAGIPRFTDDVLTASNTLGTDLGSDDYYIDGRLLVPVALLNVTAGSAAVTVGTVQPGESFPLAFLSQGVSWAYFRTDVDDSNRYFFNGSTWVMQTKAGHLRQFGIPLDHAAIAPTGSVEVVDSNTLAAVAGADVRQRHRQQKPGS